MRAIDLSFDFVGLRREGISGFEEERKMRDEREREKKNLNQVLFF